MTFKRKSVTFNDKVTTICPTFFDGACSPAAMINVPATPKPSPNLDPMYLTWLHAATKVQYQSILNGTFASYIYLQNFDLHENLRLTHRAVEAHMREAAVYPLAEKYGSLGWGSLYQDVDEGAWVRNYREIYHFEGSDEQLLEKIAEAYIQIKFIVAEEEKDLVAHVSADASIHISLTSGEWVIFTQGVGALVEPAVEPALKPGCVDAVFDATADDASFKTSFDTSLDTFLNPEGYDNEPVKDDGSQTVMAGEERTQAMDTGFQSAKVSRDGKSGARSEVRLFDVVNGERWARW